MEKLFSYNSASPAAILLLSLIASSVAADCPTTCVVQNFDADFGFDNVVRQFLPVANASQCVSLCKGVLGVNLYTYIPSTSYCNCFSACGDVQSKASAVTGLLSACSPSSFLQPPSLTSTTTTSTTSSSFSSSSSTSTSLPSLSTNPSLSSAVVKDDTQSKDANGDSFCLTTDTNLHVNVLVKGSSPDRTFLRELAFLWKDESGVAHTLHLVARNGKQQERGNGFIASLMLDNKPLPVPSKVGEELQSAGLTFAFEGTHKNIAWSFLDVDHFRLKIADLADVSVEVMTGHPREQSPGEAETHFNLIFNRLKASETVHGVLGQTHLSSGSQLMRLFKALDGSTMDYKTSSITSPDCKFSSFL